MNDYTPNSHRFKEEQTQSTTTPAEKKKVEKVVTGTVKTKKKSGAHKLAEIFISEDITNVKEYIIMDVVVPAIKNTIEDIVINGIRLFLRGETSDRRNGSRADKISYNKFSSNSISRNNDSNRTRVGYSYDDVVLETRGEAEDVLDRMGELIELYGVVSVADLYDLVGKSCNYTDNKYGWVNIRNAEPIRVRDGYMLKLPKASPIN